MNINLETEGRGAFIQKFSFAVLYCSLCCATCFGFS